MNIVKSIKTAGTRSSAVAERPCDALCQLKCCTTVIRIMQTDRVSASEALPATATFYSATSRHNYRTASMQCCVCRQQTSTSY